MANRSDIESQESGQHLGTEPIVGQADRITLAKRIISGQETPKPMSLPESLSKQLERDFKSLPPLGALPVSEAARREITDWVSLQFHYGSGPVACFTTRDKTLVPLAAGNEIPELLKGLTEDEAAQVVIEYLPPHLGLGSPELRMEDTTSA